MTPANHPIQSLAMTPFDRHPRTAAATLALALAGAATLLAPVHAGAQTMEDRGYRPVDQLYEDVDPMQRSLRRRDAGLHTTGERQNVFRPSRSTRGGAPARLLFVSEGVVAEYDRSIYAFDLRSRRAMPVIPPNTVFHIGVPPAEGLGRVTDTSGEAGHPADAGETPAQLRRRAELAAGPTPIGRPIDRRLNPRLDLAVETDPDGRAAAAGTTPPRAAEASGESRDFRRVAEAHRRRVAIALRRIAARYAADPDAPRAGGAEPVGADADP